jgi:DNA-binding HxlR family transcriptional regulator
MASHADYCPIATCVDILGDRWTPLVIRELMVGATGFNEIHRGIPRASRTLLSQRLRQLERLGLVSRESAERGRAGSYRLTESGEALTPIVWAMGHWAAEWIFADPTDEDCDGLSTIWRMHQHVVPSKLPATRVVVHVILTGSGAAQGWLDLQRGGVTVCKDDQGHDVDLVLEADTAAVMRWLMGRSSFKQLQLDGTARLIGPSRLVRAFPGWFDNSLFIDGLRRGEQRRAKERRDAVAVAS